MYTQGTQSQKYICTHTRVCVCVCVCVWIFSFMEKRLLCVTMQEEG